MTARALALIRTKQVSRTDLAQRKNIKERKKNSTMTTIL